MFRYFLIYSFWSLLFYLRINMRMLNFSPKATKKKSSIMKKQYMKPTMQVMKLAAERPMLNVTSVQNNLNIILITEGGDPNDAG